MDDKLRSECIEVLRDCISQAQECINACQLFADKCSTYDLQECAAEIGKCKVATDKGITIAREAEVVCQEALDETDDPDTIAALSQFVAQSRRFILKCQAVIHACETTTEDCNLMTLELLQLAQECSQGSDTAIKVLQK